MSSNDSIEIKSAGILTTVQDAGRFGYQSSGMPVCGPMDPVSFQLANILLGNAPDAACLEATINGPAIVFHNDTRFVITGAHMEPKLNGADIPNNWVIKARQKDVLRLGFTKRGCRAYIGFQGGIDVPLVMGSRSTYLAGNLGGYQGRPLKDGDTLPLGKEKGNPRSLPVSAGWKDKLFSDDPIRILPGPEVHFFGSPSIQKLLSATFTIGANSNRMAYTLEGEQIPPLPGKTDIISAAVPTGTIQVPANGTPLLLMADRQTSGGYPRIAVVCSADICRLGQKKPGDTISFREISLEEAQKRCIEQSALLQSLSSKP